MCRQAEGTVMRPSRTRENKQTNNHLSHFHYCIRDKRKKLSKAANTTTLKALSNEIALEHSFI
jgi:hypothetical protein